MVNYEQWEHEKRDYISGKLRREKANPWGVAIALGLAGTLAAIFTPAFDSMGIGYLKEKYSQTKTSEVEPERETKGLDTSDFWK